MLPLPRVNIDEPRWDQTSYWGRVRHFLSTTNPLNTFCSNSELDQAKTIVDRYRAGEELEGYSMDDVYRAKVLVDSAFHPDTGEKMALLGRMSSQVPVNMVIIGGMITFYKSPLAVVFWLCANQSFNAVVNYTNRSGKTPIALEQLAKSYLIASGGAVFAALTLIRMAKKAPPLIARLVPFFAGAAANCINIPVMRSRELTHGVPVYDANNNYIGDSRIAARRGIAAVVLSRNTMGASVMVLTPLVINSLEHRAVFRRAPWASAPLQMLTCGFFLTFAAPMCCALFPQKSSIQVKKLEISIQEKARNINPPPTVAWYNKGL